MASKWIYRVGICLVAVALSACAMLGSTKKEPLTIGDVNHNLKPIAGTPLDAVQTQKITYAVTGNAEYDKFFKEAAIAYGGFAVANTMSEDVATNMKGYAHAFASSNQKNPEVEALTKGKNLEALTLEDSIAIVTQQQKLTQLQVEERDYFLKAAHNIATASVSLNGSIEAAPKLLPQAKKLMADVNTAFKPWSSPEVAKELQDSITKLTKVQDDAIPLAKNLTRFSALLVSLAGEGAQTAQPGR